METGVSHISLIGALGKNTRAIGINGGLIWNGLKEDMIHFKEQTTGHSVIMGRNTWLSLPEKYRPLPNRTNIVITSKKEAFDTPGAHIVSSLEEAIAYAKTAPGGEEVFVIGGGRVYTDALPFADRLYLTLIESEDEGDTFFPEYENVFTKVIDHEEHPEYIPSLTFLTLER